MFGSQLSLDPRQLPSRWDRAAVYLLRLHTVIVPGTLIDAIQHSCEHHNIAASSVLLRLTGCIRTYLDQSNLSCLECGTAQIQHSALALKGEVGFQTGKAFEQFMRMRCCTKHTKSNSF